MANERREAARPAAPVEPAAAAAGAGQIRVAWDDTNMRSSYANVANVASTREEVVLLFGINQAWHAGQREVKIQLTDRIILSPFAAKRLSILLGNLLREYEGKFGPLPVEGGRGGESVAP
jgi:hypothetical protein